MQDSETPGQVLEPFILLGLLANYNKFEFQNPYQLRFNDFVNEETIQKTIRCIGYTCQALRLDYIDVQDDLPEGWTFSNTLNLLGFGLIIRGSKPEKKPVYDAETAKQLFSNLYARTYSAIHIMRLIFVGLARARPPFSHPMILHMPISFSASTLCRFQERMTVNDQSQATCHLRLICSNTLIFPTGLPTTRT